MQMLITDNARNRHVHNYPLKIEHINLVSQLQVKCLQLAILSLGCCQCSGLIPSKQALQEISLIVQMAS